METCSGIVPDTSPSHQGALVTGLGRCKQILQEYSDLKGKDWGITGHKVPNNAMKMSRGSLINVLENGLGHQTALAAGCCRS